MLAQYKTLLVLVVVVVFNLIIISSFLMLQRDYDAAANVACDTAVGLTNRERSRTLKPSSCRVKFSISARGA